MKYLVLLFALIFSSLASADAKIYFPYQPRWNLNGYLMHMIMKVPMEQYGVSADGKIMYFHGRIWLETHDLPENVRPLVEGALREALAGKRQISGATIDASEAKVFFSNELHPGYVESQVPEMSVAILDKHYIAESGVMGPPGPAPKDSVEQLERLERANQQSEHLPFHCQMLLENIGR